jgi:hypothetical protein
LAGGVSGLRVNLAVDEGDQVGGGEAAGDVRDAEIDDGLTALGVMAGEIPGERATPVMTDPNGAVMGEQVEHIVNAVFERVIGVGAAMREGLSWSAGLPLRKSAGTVFSISASKVKRARSKCSS